ncbi:MAG: Fic family protein [Candidatus Gastranaerophilales bacterium]|nr:Fic family protein [Candidatus Gastranaerophilales bacterium]
MQLTKRQSKIFDFINENQSVKRAEVENYINSVDEKISKVTIIRDLEALLKNNLIKKSGKARSIAYHPAQSNELLRKYNVTDYFNEDTDTRKIKYTRFNFDIFTKLKKIFNSQEILQLEKINGIYREKIGKLSPAVLRKEFERILIELSWKSSQIEGNTYSLLDTEVLVKDNIEAEGHKKEEAFMILNHKKALEYIFENSGYYKTLTLKKIEELHIILTADLNVNKGLRTSPVGIVGTNYKPLDNKHQIKEAMEKLIKKINETENIIAKALITVLMISYIQPFEDGNKRTGRILANAILFANEYCPLSYRSIKESEYKKAVILFYENNSLEYFKNLFMEQFKFAVDKYF